MDLAGRWRKVSSAACAAAYPQEARPGGRRPVHRLEQGPSDHHPIWDRGGWQETGPGRVRISLANDAEREYEVSLDGDVLTFVDADGCRFEYARRLAQPENGT